MPVTRSASEQRREQPSKALTDKLDALDNKINNLYSDVYITRPDNRNNLDYVINNLDSALDRLQGDDVTVSNMSELMRRIDKRDSTNTKDLMESVGELFGDSNLLGVLAQNDHIHKYIAAENYTYDLLCKYMPKLKMALEIVRDNVLCSDNINKNFINPQLYKSLKSEIELFNSNVKKIEREYGFAKFFEKTYWNTSKYGEEFIYIVPYQVAFQRLIKRQNRRALTGTQYNANMTALGEEYGYLSRPEHVIQEGYTGQKEFKSYLTKIDKEYDHELAQSIAMSNFGENCQVNLFFNDTAMIQAPVHEHAVLQEKSQISAFRSLSSIREEYLNEKDSSLKDIYSKVTDGNDKLSAASLTSYDGLVIPDNLVRDPDRIDKNFTGAVVERIPRQNILPVYMGDHCFGYYYFEFATDKTACGYCGGHHGNVPGAPSANYYNKEYNEQQEEVMLRFISDRISSAIDTHFINANKDLKEEIYAILHYNEQFDINRINNIGITFIPADDIIHCYFNLDEDTHRGISDLKDSLIPGMLYILLYLTDIIGRITRGTDKRIYYVKQNIETNTARTMMNVVKQIKKGNMGMRQIESMNNILNIVGKYNDFIIPQSPGGEPPIDFQIMNGQDIQTPTDIMDRMEEMAINPIIPFEFVNSVMQQDFATRFTMSNTRFMKFVFTRQADTERWGTDMYTKVYNYEFDENYPEIKIVLPPPVYLVMTNSAQLLDNMEQVTQKIIDYYLVNEDESVQLEFKKLYIKDALSTYLDHNKIERILEAARVNLKADQGSATQDGESSADYM